MMVKIRNLIDKYKYNKNLKKIRKDPSLLFQLVIYYNDLPKIQILRQKSLIGDEKFTITEENGLAFFISLGTKQDLISNFKSSKYYENHVIVDSNKGIYAFLCSGEFENIDSVSLYLMHNIFGFREDYDVTLKLLS